MACPGGPRGPGVDHGRQGQRLTVAGGQAQSSLQGHILQEKQSSSEKVSDQVALLLGVSFSVLSFPICRMEILLPSPQTRNFEQINKFIDAVPI